MRTAPQQAAAILETLAAALPGAFLAQHFPEQSGQEIRRILTETAESIKGSKPKPQTARSAPVQPAVTAPNAAPGHDRLILYSDGASRGNPGLAGAGIHILDQAQHEILAASKFLGQCTNNEAEYQALIFGLQEARRLGAKEISIYLDSELVVRQLKGIYQVKNERLKTLFAQAKRELSHFAKRQIGHVPRAQNQRADQMANRGIDER